MDIIELYELYKKFPSVQTDSRNLKPNDIFFALKGKNFNGNQFAKQAIDNGAAYAVIDEKVPIDFGIEIAEKIILVDDVLITLQQLANHHRRQFDIPFLAITGSNGKTTTKELIHAVLSATFKTYTTEGNLNNHIGVPLTILRIRDDAEIAVIEMGANHVGEIASYCQISLPTHGVITNCGKAHLEGFGDMEGVKKGKGELYDHLRKNRGTAFVMWDYDYLRSMSHDIPEIIKYGTANADVVGTVLETDPFLYVKTKDSTVLSSIKTNFVGEYNLPNVLAAVAVGKYFKVSEEKIKAAIENYFPSNNRSQLIEHGSNKIILDAYNANPSSMKLAIENLAHLKAENKVLVLGDMAELGTDSLQEHQGIVDLVRKFQWKEVLLVGIEFSKTKHNFHFCENTEAAKQWLQQQHFENTYILIKGSRNSRMEKVLED